MKKIIILLGLVFVFSFSSSVLAQDMKMGYVDIFKVFNDYDKTKDFDKQLEEEKDKAEKKLDTKKEELQKLQSKLNVVNDKEKEKQEKALIEAAGQYKDLERNALADIRKERDEKMKEVIDDIDKVVKAYAEKNKYDLILNQNAILYGGKVKDITPDILKEANKSYKKK